MGIRADYNSDTRIARGENPNRESYLNFNIAGFSHYEGAFVFSKLKIGTPLQLINDEKNKYDAEAVAIYLKDKKLGYVPSSLNTTIYKILKMQHYDVFDVVVTQLAPEEHPEQQVRVAVFIKKKKIDKKRK